MTPGENIADNFWLNQSATQKVLQQLEQWKQEKLILASRAARNPQQVSDVELRLLLREASVVEEVITLINTGKS